MGLIDYHDEDEDDNADEFALASLQTDPLVVKARGILWSASSEPRSIFYLIYRGGRFPAPQTCGPGKLPISGTPL